MSSIVMAWTAGRRGMAPTLPALLCLGEMRRGRGSPGPEGSPQPACSLRGPQGPGGSRGGEALLRAEGRPLTGLSSRAECGPEDPGAGW